MPGNSILVLNKLCRKNSGRLVSSAAHLRFCLAGDAMTLHTGSVCYSIYFTKQNNKTSVLD